MRNYLICFLGFWLPLACSTGQAANRTKNPFDAYRTDSPVKLEADLADFYGNVSYGKYDRNVLDLWVANTDKPSPLVIFFHGGGFQGGDKSSVYQRDAKAGLGANHIQEFLEKGISFATVNYRLLEKNETEGVLKSLNDAKRAVQFLRYHADELNLNANRIALSGSSAGGGTALWLAFSDDLADPESKDPVERQSTRVYAVAVNEVQSTYDLLRWEKDVFPENMFAMSQIENTGFGKRITAFYGVKNFEALNREDIATYRKRVDMMEMISKDDPSVYILNKKEFQPSKGNRMGNLLHSPYHAVALREIMKKEGVEHEVFIPAEGIKSKPRFMSEFLIEKLTP